MRKKTACPPRGHPALRSGQDVNVDDPTLREWSEWKSRRRRKAATRERDEVAVGIREAADAFDLDFKLNPLDLHGGLTKAKSSLLTQARTGAIGLDAVLHRRRVPEIESPLCQEGCAPETFAHLMLRCPRYASEKGGLAGWNCLTVTP
ncbi:hypothetical protein N7461_000300 [Penicillium sp. DV-2018c]|nr:hypothetical protein N7461_000300 [Penicillium sp. DV-2018c]